MDRQRRQRRGLRLQAYDYRRPGSYFVTICTWERRCIFDDPRCYQIAEQQWLALAVRFRYLDLDSLVIMPNHLHGIILIKEHDLEQPPPYSHGKAASPAGSLGAIVRSYKGEVTRRIRRSRNAPAPRIWQRGFWERVVRNEPELAAIRRYIANNPLRWAEDHDNLDALLTRMEAAPDP